MNELKVFENAEFGKVRSIEVDGIPYFVGKDVAEILGYQNGSRDINRHVDEEDRVTEMIPQYQNGTLVSQAILINESGLYSLILSSKMPNAKKFKRWVTSEVLPAIRQTGSYQRPMTQAEILAGQAQLLVEMERKTNEIKIIAEETQNKLDKAIDVFATPTKETWKDVTNKKINDMCMKYGLSYPIFRNELYRELEMSAHCKLSIRQNKLRERMRMAGSTYAERQAISKIDVIEKDDKLRLIFDGIVKKYQVKYII